MFTSAIWYRELEDPPLQTSGTAQSVIIKNVQSEAYEDDLQI